MIESTSELICGACLLSVIVTVCGILLSSSYSVSKSMSQNKFPQFEKITEKVLTKSNKYETQTKETEHIDSLALKPITSYRQDSRKSLSPSPIRNYQLEVRPPSTTKQSTFSKITVEHCVVGLSVELALLFGEDPIVIRSSLSIIQSYFSVDKVMAFHLYALSQIRGCCGLSDGYPSQFWLALASCLLVAGEVQSLIGISCPVSLCKSLGINTRRWSNARDKFLRGIGTESVSINPEDKREWIYLLSVGGNSLIEYVRISGRTEEFVGSVIDEIHADSTSKKSAIVSSTTRDKNQKKAIRGPVSGEDKIMIPYPIDKWTEADGSLPSNYVAKRNRNVIEDIQTATHNFANDSDTNHKKVYSRKSKKLHQDLI